ncbi:unnamed protein product [Mytilus edulis]|uniref:Uncharacterized protein n=1 Tax=Mytilus edulis TaxID=6550 RepID=A0A8S3TVP8_MYTED|nr:unnamed protein product [Mytilus edulis]
MSSEVEADQTLAPTRRQGLRRCSSATCLSDGNASDKTPLEHPDLMRVRHLSFIKGAIKPCLKSPTKKQDGSGSIASLNYSRGRESDSDMNDDIFETASVRSEDIFLSSEQKQQKNQSSLLDSFVLILSGLYGILLVVIGSVVPIAETFVHSYVRHITFEVFYIYLYAVSICFIIYIYMFLLHDSPVAVGNLKRSLSERGKKRLGPSSPDTENCLPDTWSQISRSKRRKITFNNTMKQTAASFYLRLGAVVFGIGCMILEGLYIGQLLEISHSNDPCAALSMIIRPVLKPCFTFSQLFFIFRNSKMVVYKGRSIARFGFMHMAATNICSWFRSIVMETLQSFAETIAEQRLQKFKLEQESSNMTDVSHQSVHIRLPLAEFSCRYSNMIGGMLMNFSHYLYPFCIEYSVICAGILYVMWKNIGVKEKLVISESEDKEENRQRHRMSVDCSGSSRGLFLGIFVFVGMVCSMIVFYVISKHDPDAKHTAIIVHSTEIIILSFAMAAIIGAAVSMRNLHFIWKTKDMLEETLILVSMTGLYMFSMFSLIAAFFYKDTTKGVLMIIVHILMICVATAQTIFMIFGLRLSAKNVNHVKSKPGREFVTFLLLCNFSLWFIATFEIQKAGHNPQQLEFYGAKAWTIFTHISVPLGIFYFFHSTVCLSHIWKHAWKFKKISKI